MVDRSPKIQSGFLRLDGAGDCSVQEMRSLLQAIDISYQAVARIELAAQATLVATETIPQGLRHDHRLAASSMQGYSAFGGAEGAKREG
jgi:hypothetical protein